MRPQYLADFRNLSEPSNDDLVAKSGSTPTCVYLPSSLVTEATWLCNDFQKFRSM